MKFEHLKPGMTVYDVHSYRMGNTLIRSVGVWPVSIVSVAPKLQTVVASWNGNQPTVFFRRSWSKWRLKEPVLVATGFCGQHRLQTREEKQAAKKETCHDRS